MKRLVLLLVGVLVLSACAPILNAVTGLPEGEVADFTGKLPGPADGPPQVSFGGIAPGTEAPDFTLPTLDGEMVSLASYRGQPVLLNFWATWCPPCRAEMPAMQRVYETYRDDGFVVLAVNVRESEEPVRAFIEELGLTFPILMDEKGDVTNTYRVYGLPTTYFLDREGRVYRVQVGAMTEEFMETTVKELVR